MKRAKRDRVLRCLYAELESGDFDVREFAMFQLVLMLRRANDGPSSSDIIDEVEHLSRDQMRLRLSHGDQAQITAHLLRVVSRQAGSRATAFWALGEVAPDIAFAPVISVIGEQGKPFNDETAYQACRALRRWLESDSLDSDELKVLKDDDRLSSCLKRWSRSSDIRLAKCASAIIGLARERSN
ncbi:MAG: hypothetical protein OXG53_07770 [Chloroflexi bacterium]|nr:hypothetical protein [Chloroflexota bacterium]